MNNLHGLRASLTTYHTTGTKFQPLDLEKLTVSSNIYEEKEKLILSLCELVQALSMFRFSIFNKQLLSKVDI